MRSMTVIEWAKAEGISKVAAYKRLKRLGIQPDQHGLIDVDRTAAAWAAGQDVRQKARSAGRKAASPAMAAASPVGPKPRHRDGSLADAQRENEWLKVSERELALKVKEGELVPIAPINAWVAGSIVRARELVERAIKELPDRLAPEQDPVRIGEILGDTLLPMLGQLSEYRANG